MFSTIGIHEYRGGDEIMSTMGDILSTVRDTQYHGEYHDACGGYHEYHWRCSVGTYKLLLFEYLHGTEHPPRYS